MVLILVLRATWVCAVGTLPEEIIGAATGAAIVESTSKDLFIYNNVVEDK